MEELTKEADAKVQMLEYTSAKTCGIVQKGSLGAVECQCKNLKELLKEVDLLKLRVQQTMLDMFGKSAEEDRSLS